VRDDSDDLAYESKQPSGKQVCLTFNYTSIDWSLKCNAMTERSVDMAEISFIQFLLTSTTWQNLV